MTAKQVFYEGRVQGVGFRYGTKREAMGFDVTGWIANLSDGRVEMQVMGDDDGAGHAADQHDLCQHASRLHWLGVSHPMACQRLA